MTPTPPPPLESSQSSIRGPPGSAEGQLPFALPLLDSLALHNGTVDKAGALDVRPSENDDVNLIATRGMMSAQLTPRSTDPLVPSPSRFGLGYIVGP